MEQSLGDGSSSSVQMMSQNLHHMILKFEELQKANNESDARLRNISVENAKLKEEVEVLKKNQSTLQKEKESLQETLTKRQDMLKQDKDRDVSLLQHGLEWLQRLQENVTMEQKSVNDKLADQKRSTLRYLFEVTKANSALTKLETRYNTTEQQLLTTITNLQRAQVSVWLLFFSISWSNKSLLLLLLLLLLYYFKRIVQ